MSQRALVAVLLLNCVFALVSASAALPATKKPPAHPIDINSASSVQLQEVPGIGPATADKILAMRKSYGAFKSVDDLLSVRGIGPKRLEKMRKYLVAGHARATPRDDSAVDSHRRARRARTVRAPRQWPQATKAAARRGEGLEAGYSGRRRGRG